MTPTINEVQIQPIKPNNGLIAFASVVIDDNLYLGSIGVHTKLNGSGYRLTYPTKPLGSQRQNVYHPINRMTAEAIEVAVISRLKEVLSKQNDRHNGTDTK